MTDLSIYPVIESPIGADLLPWRVLSARELSQVPLDKDNLQCMGTLMAAICYGEKIASVADLVDLIRCNGHENFTAYGGFVISHLGDTIYPSCCGTLNTWREWRAFLNGGATPWFGHDPAGWAELVDDCVVVWGDGALNNTPLRTDPCIRVTKVEFDLALKTAEQQVVRFFDQLPVWLCDVTSTADPEIVQKVLSAFTITQECK